MLDILKYTMYFSEEFVLAENLDWKYTTLIENKRSFQPKMVTKKLNMKNYYLYYILYLI